MLTAALATAAAMGWGAADYLGAKATRTASAERVVLLTQVVGLPVLAVWLAATATKAPTLSALGWGVAAGVFSLLGMVLLYRTLASGGVALVAPVTAVTVALVPLVVGLFLSAAPGPLALCGVCCAIVSIALVSWSAPAVRGSAATRTLLLALAAGGALGLQLVCLSRPGSSAGLWPLAGARACSILCALPLVLRRHQDGQSLFSGVRWPLVVLTGALDTSGFGFFLFAMDHGLLSVVGPIVSLYPAATIALALIIDRERVSTPHMVGICLGVSALVLVAV